MEQALIAANLTVEMVIQTILGIDSGRGLSVEISRTWKAGPAWTVQVLIAWTLNEGGDEDCEGVLRYEAEEWRRMLRLALSET